MKLFGLFSIAAIISVSMLSAGSFENFKSSEFSNFKQYKDERDTAFNNYLKSEWKVYQEHLSKPIYEKSKPKKLPIAIAQPIKKIGPKVNIKIKKIKPLEIPKEVKIVPKNTSLVFFGTLLEFEVSNDIKTANYFPRNQKGVTSFFQTIASSNHEELVNDIQKVKIDLNLNDWGIYLLTLELSKLIYSDHNNAKLFSWFIFNKLGYAVKVGIVNKHVVLLHYSKKIIYSTPNYTFSKKKFYALSHYNKGSVGRLYTYAQNYPGSDAPLDLSLKSLPNFAQNKQNKDLSFINNGENIKIEFTYNKNLIDFMATYPQADYETYFNAPLENTTNTQILKALKKHIDGKKTSEAMNFVLHFVQKSFKYEVDNQQFGREKVMFAQETLYYNKSDCEDRAVLFSYLVKELFGVGIIGIKYMDHMATALYIPMQGDSVMAGLKRFVIADPTYINANIGQSMPKYISKKPNSFIVVR
ncbi:MAG: hypothetical protein L3I99_00045 [Sulfurimonas sp.]|nr:hypothetical protein [Sulfurimonas sp.]